MQQRNLLETILVWLCPTTANPSPAAVTKDAPVGPAAQGIDPTEFDEFVKAIRNGAGYVNVHSSKYPPGEIRGQLGRDD